MLQRLWDFTTTKPGCLSVGMRDAPHDSPCTEPPPPRCQAIQKRHRQVATGVGAVLVGAAANSWAWTAQAHPASCPHTQWMPKQRFGQDRRGRAKPMWRSGHGWRDRACVITIGVLAPTSSEPPAQIQSKSPPSEYDDSSTHRALLPFAHMAFNFSCAAFSNCGLLLLRRSCRPSPFCGSTSFDVSHSPASLGTPDHCAHSRAFPFQSTSCSRFHPQGLRTIIEAVPAVGLTPKATTIAIPLGFAHPFSSEEALSLTNPIALP